MKIWFIRHGKTKGNQERRYVGKTDESILEGERMVLQKKAERLQEQTKSFLDEQIVLYTSPMRRCIETAQILFPQKAISVVDELRECDFGRFEYKNYEELKDDLNYQKWIDSGGILPFPNGESKAIFEKRCIQAFDQIVEKEKEKGRKLLIFVVHGGTMMAILGAYGIPKKDYFDWQTGNGCGYLCELHSQNGKELEVCQSI